MAEPTEQEIIRRESGGNPNIGWAGVDLTNAPRDPYGFPIWEGRMGPQGISHAAGLYQFQPGTWRTYAKQLGISDFSPESQRRVYLAARAAEGARPWAASEPKASPEVEGIVRGRTPEQQAAMGTPLEIRPRPEGDFDKLAALTLLMKGPVAPGSPTPESDGLPPANQIIQSLMTGGSAPSGQQQPQSQGEINHVFSPPLPENVLPTAGEGVPTFRPAGSAAGGGESPAAAPASPTVPVPAVPRVSAPPPAASSDSSVGNILSALMRGPIAVGQFMRGANEGLMRGGEQLKADIPNMPGPEAAGAFLGRIPGGAVEGMADLMKRGGEAATGQGPMPTPQEALGMAMIGATGSIGRGGLGAGPRLPARIEPPALRGAMRWTPNAEELEIARDHGIPTSGSREEFYNAYAADLARASPGQIPFLQPENEAAFLEAQRRLGLTFEDAIKAAREYRARSEGQGAPPAQGGGGGAAPPIPPTGGAPGAASPGPRGGAPGGPVRPMPEGEVSAATESAQFNQPVLGKGSALERALERLFLTGDQAAARAARIADRDVAQAELRQAVGQARREKAAAAAELEQFRADLTPLIPDFERYIREVHAGVPDPKPSAIMDMIDRIEGVKPMPEGAENSLAGAIRRIYDRVRSDIERDIPDRAGFIEDYYTHIWKDVPGKSGGIAQVGRQGSGRSLRERIIPTIGEGIRLGLTPKFLDPVENVLHYVSGMEDYLAMHRAFNAGRTADYIHYYRPGEAPEGWEKLRGRWSQVSPEDTSVIMDAFAPAGYARAWNNHFGRGFHALPWAGALYDGALHAKNLISATLFSLSGYHPLAMLQESQASVLARSVGELTNAEIAQATKSLGLGAIMPVKGVGDTFGVGQQLRQQYLRLKDFGPEMEQIADLYASAGGRVVGRGPEWSGSAGENYFKAWQRGRLMSGIAERSREAVSGRAPIPAAAGAVKAITGEIAKVMETISSPVFDEMIPRLKSAAFYDEMTGWMRANPGATQAEKLAAARRFVDTIDDRFGEMVMDNIFWPRAAKQTLQILSTSLGWELGSLRSMGYGARDIMRGQLSPRVRYLMGLGAAVALGNSMYQYLMSGTAPSSGLDAMLPLTGGKTPEGKPERAIMPGFEKDFIGYWHDPIGEFAGKLSPFARLGLQAFTGRDSFGRTIAPYPARTPAWFRAWGNQVLQSMAPIPWMQDRLKGTAIPSWQQYMGIKPGPAYMTDPARIDRIETATRIRDLTTQARSIAARAARTQTERKVIDQKLRDIQEEIRGLQRDLQRRERARAPAAH